MKRKICLLLAAILFCVPVLAFAALNGYNFSIVDEDGNILSTGIRVQVQAAGGSTAETIYSDGFGKVAATNPITSLSGVVSFYYGANTCDVVVYDEPLTTKIKKSGVTPLDHRITFPKTQIISQQLATVTFAATTATITTDNVTTLNVSGVSTLHSASFSDSDITNVGDIKLDSISADATSFSMGSNWTNAGRTVADAGILTTVDINGGTIDGTTIGGSAAGAGTFTTLAVDTVSDTEIHFLDGVTSAIQTQIAAKQATITGAATTVVTSDLTGNRAVIANATGKLAVSATTDTEIGYVAGVTSDIQTQMNSKAPLASPTFTGTVTIPTPFTIGAVSVLPTGTELNFVDGVTSAIQTQIDTKLPKTLDIVDRDTDYAILSTDTGKIITNYGATQSWTYTLPTAAAGLVVDVLHTDTDNLKVVKSGSDTILGTTNDSLVIATGTLGGSVKLIATRALQWVITGREDTWTDTTVLP